MLTTVEGVFRDGRIELREAPPGVEGARVIVTVPAGSLRIWGLFTPPGL